MRLAATQRVAVRLLTLLVLVGAVLVVPASAQTLPECRRQCVSTFAACLGGCAEDPGPAGTLACANDCRTEVLRCWLACWRP